MWRHHCAWHSLVCERAKWKLTHTYTYDDDRVLSKFGIVSVARDVSINEFLLFGPITFLFFFTYYTFSHSRTSESLKRIISISVCSLCFMNPIKIHSKSRNMNKKKKWREKKSWQQWYITNKTDLRWKSKAFKLNAHSTFYYRFRSRSFRMEEDEEKKERKTFFFYERMRREKRVRLENSRKEKKKFNNYVKEKRWETIGHTPIVMTLL